MSTCYSNCPARPERAECRHCKKLRPVHRRKLCHGCYEQPAIRKLYPRSSRSPHAHLGGFPDRPAGVPRPLPPRPTGAEPGSPEKVAVLIARAAAGQALWHPGDATRSAADWPVDLSLFGALEAHDLPPLSGVAAYHGEDAA